MYVRFWGTRGSIATPGAGTARYGGNTPCVEVRAEDGTRIILDCGTGARELGGHLLRTGPKPLRLNLFIGHTHWDHIQGFPFFVPAFLPDTELNIYAPAGFQRSLEEALAGQMQYSYFPVKLRDLRSRLHFTELEEGFFRVGEVLVETQHLNHTAPNLAYRIASGGATVAYVADHEPFWKPAGLDFHHPGDQRHIAFLHGADLVIHDAQYTEEEYATRLGWGHSTVEYATDVALLGGAGRLALFHHDPDHDDETIARLEARARARVAERGAALDVFAAADGQELEVRGSGQAPCVAEVSALRRRPIDGGRVLVVSANQADVAAIGQVLTEDGLVLQHVADAQTALARIQQIAPELAIINARLSDGDGAALVRPLRSALGRDDLPVLLLTEAPDAEAARHSARAGATDYLAKPFSPPMLRTRVRAWLARTQRGTGAPPDDESHPATSAVERSPAATAGLEGTVATAKHPGLLASVPLFRQLSREQLEILARRSVEQTYQAGQTLIHQDDPADSLFVVLSGRVRVIEATADAPHVEVVLGELGPGEIVGEMGILGDQPRSATVVAVENARCLRLPQSDFVQVLRASPEFAIDLLRLLSKKIYDADRLLARYAPDPLTGLGSRRTFHDQYRRVAAGARRRHSTVILMLLDVVDLKMVNDRFGYTVGDDVLRTVSDALMEATRQTDLVARYGGDEFAVLLVDAGPRAVDLVVGRVEQKLAELAPRRGLPLAVHCSIGITTSQVPPETPDALLWEADQDMHRRQAGPPDRPAGRPARTRRTRQVPA